MFLILGARNSKINFTNNPKNIQIYLIFSSSPTRQGSNYLLEYLKNSSFVIGS